MDDINAETIHTNKEPMLTTDSIDKLDGHTTLLSRPITRRHNEGSHPRCRLTKLPFCINVEKKRKEPNFVVRLLMNYVETKRKFCIIGTTFIIYHILYLMSRCLVKVVELW